jgi:hypothetical protein
MAKMEIWKKKDGKDIKVATMWDIAPEVVEDKVKLTFLGGFLPEDFPKGKIPFKPPVIPRPSDVQRYTFYVEIPKVEIEDFYKKLGEVI